MSEEGFYVTLPSHSNRKEFPENKANSFKVRLPHPLRLEGTDWKVGLSSISVPDASIDLNRFKSLKFPLLSAQWMLKRQDDGNRVQSRSLTTDLTFQDILYDDNIVDGLSFMKALVFKFDQVKENKRMVDDLTQSPDNGKKWEYTFKWEGEELVLDNSNLDISEVKTEGVPYYMSFNEDLAFDMGWVQKNEKEDVLLGPNLKSECQHATVPDPIDVVGGEWTTFLELLL